MPAHPKIIERLARIYLDKTKKDKKEAIDWANRTVNPEDIVAIQKEMRRIKAEASEP